MSVDKVAQWMQMAGLPVPAEATAGGSGPQAAPHVQGHCAGGRGWPEDCVPGCGKGGSRPEEGPPMQSFAREGGLVTTPVSAEARDPSLAAAAASQAAQVAQLAEIQQATTGQPLSWQQLQLMQGRRPSADTPVPGGAQANAPSAAASSQPAEGAAGAAAAAAEPCAGYNANDLTTVDSEEMEEYQRYVAALQLQYAAMGALGAEAAAAAASSDMRAGPGGLLGAPAPGCSSSARTAGSILSHDPHRRYTGTVFKWDDDAGWGFVSCIEARKVYGKDVFLHKAEIGGISDLYKQRTKVEVKNGDWVSFQVEISRGKPRARDVEKIDTPEEYTRGQQSLLEREHSLGSSLRSDAQWHSNDRDHWWGKRKREE